MAWSNNRPRDDAEGILDKSAFLTGRVPRKNFGRWNFILYLRDFLYQIFHSILQYYFDKKLDLFEKKLTASDFKNFYLVTSLLRKWFHLKRELDHHNVRELNPRIYGRLAPLKQALLRKSLNTSDILPEESQQEEKSTYRKFKQLWEKKPVVAKLPEIPPTLYWRNTPRPSFNPMTSWQKTSASTPLLGASISRLLASSLDKNRLIEEVEDILQQEAPGKTFSSINPG